MFGLIGKLKTHPGQRKMLVGHLLSAASLLQVLEGCYLYVISRATNDPDTMWVTEVWRSQDDHRASLNHEAVKALITAARPLLAEPPSGFEVAPVGGKGLPTSG
jgi:quinol monooxygenase YgiN